MRLLITGATGVLGRSLRPLMESVGHEFVMPGREELDLFDPTAVADAVRGADGVLHVATRIRTLDQISDPEAWLENDRLRADASRILVDAAIAAGRRSTSSPPSPSSTRRTGRRPRTRQSARSCRSFASSLVAEEQTERFARAGGRGVVVRFGLLDGQGLVRPADGRLRRHAARPRCGARAPLGTGAAERHLQRLSSRGARLVRALHPGRGVAAAEVLDFRHDHLTDDRPPGPVRPAAVPATPRRPPSASERLGRAHRESRRRGRVFRGRDHERRRGRHAGL